MLQHRRVRDVMTTPVVTVGTATPLKDVITQLESARVSAVPVLDDDSHVVGMVSEVELLAEEQRFEDGQAPHRRWWRRRPLRAGARAAADLMTTPAPTIAIDASIAAAARRMEEHGLRRLVVIDDDDKMCGIITPHNLLKVFLRTDHDIHAEIVGEVLGRVLRSYSKLVRVEVHNGVVTLSGELEEKSMVGEAVRLSRQVDGVVDVIDRLTFAIDDTQPPALTEDELKRL